MLREFFFHSHHITNMNVLECIQHEFYVVGVLFDNWTVPDGVQVVA